MPAGREDDALMWDGDDDPTLDAGPGAGRATADPVGLPAGYTAVGKGSEAVAGSDTPENDEGPEVVDPGTEADSRAMGNAELITLGVLGGFAGLYAIGWLIGGLRLQGSRPYLVTDLMYQGALWLAVASPLIWFVTVLVLTAGRSAWIRFAWLITGTVLLIPWPFIMVGAVGR